MSLWQRGDLPLRSPFRNIAMEHMGRASAEMENEWNGNLGRHRFQAPIKKGVRTVGHPPTRSSGKGIIRAICTNPKTHWHDPGKLENLGKLQKKH